MNHRRLLAIVPLLLAGLLLGPGVAEAQPPEGGPATVELVTVPPAADARFRLDGQDLLTDAQGVVRLTVAAGRAEHRLELVDPAIERPGQIAEFVRWWGRGLDDQEFSPTVAGLRVRRDMRIQVGFRISYDVAFAFTDQTRDPVDVDRVSAITVRNDAGQIERIAGDGQARLVGVRPVVERSRLIAKSTTYSVQGIEIDGSNAVTAGEQRFAPEQQQAVTLTVPLRAVRIRVQDVLFGSPGGRAVEMTYPDGRTLAVPLDDNGEATVNDLVRGSYMLRVAGGGHAPAQPVELSRSQTVQLRVLSGADMTALACAAVVTVGGLFLVRRHRRRVMERGEESA